MEINWDATVRETIIINKIANRAVKTISMDKVTIAMDITACHLNGNPLELDNLLNADNSNFSHDILGINKHIDRETGELMNLFLPRFSKKELTK